MTITPDDFFDQQFEQLFRHLLKRTHADPERIQDALGDALEPFRERAGILTEEAFYAYLFTIAFHNLCRALAREHKHSDVAVDFTQTPEPEVTLPPGCALAKAELGQIGLAAFDALPPSLREPLFLKDVEGLSSAEIATSLGITKVEAYNRISRARRALQSRLEPHASDWREVSAGHFGAGFAAHVVEGEREVPLAASARDLVLLPNGTLSGQVVVSMPDAALAARLACPLGYVLVGADPHDRLASAPFLLHWHEHAGTTRSATLSAFVAPHDVHGALSGGIEVPGEHVTLYLFPA